MKGNDVSELLAKLTGSMDAKELTLMALQVSISSVITAKRIKLGMTQKQFANKMGVSQGLVSRWENGDANFTLETLVNIANVLKVSSDMLLQDVVTYSSDGIACELSGTISKLPKKDQERILNVIRALTE